MKIDGACHCGAISYEAELDPARVGICHCSDCQELSASAFRTIAIVAGETFRLTKGKPQRYVKLADSGNRRVQAFCGTCGSGIYSSEDSDTPSVYNIRLGTVIQRDQFAPAFECWRKSAVGWLPDLDGTKVFDTNPQL